MFSELYLIPMKYAGESIFSLNISMEAFLKTLIIISSSFHWVVAMKVVTLKIRYRKIKTLTRSNF